MWNKLKGFLGFLAITGCIMVWFSSIPIDPMMSYSNALELYGWLFVGFSSLAFCILLILHGVNAHLYRFKPESPLVIKKSKRVTRAVAAIFVIIFIASGLGWWLRPHLLALSALSVEQVANNARLYENREISVTGLYLSWPSPQPSPDYAKIDGFLYPREAFSSLANMWDLSVGTAQGENFFLLVSFPPGISPQSFQTYIFRGVIQFQKVWPIGLPEELPVLVVSSVIKM